MLRLKSIQLRRGTKILLDRAELTLHAHCKVGVTGANGAGKSSLFALLRMELHPDAGDLELPPGLRIAHVAQDTPALSCAALDYVLDGDVELRAIEAELAQGDQDGLQHAETLAKLEAIDGYTAQSRAARLLDGLGFSSAEMQQPVSTFSGGWRMRLNLAQALMCRSDLLLLDEPTNHLDLETVVWLEGWLKSYPGMLMMISHDRDFLDNTVTQIVHLEAATLTLYSGNYSDFENQRTERLAQQQQAYQKQQREIAHLESFITRFRAKATKARQAQSRVKALERMERIAAAHVDSPFQFSFRDPGPLPNPLLKLDEASAGYVPEHPILQAINFSIESEARLGILGVNGAGKSTLIRTLAGELPVLSGQRTESRNLRIGYFAQHQLEALRLDESPLWHLQRLAPDVREQELRDFLGGFDFHGEMATSKVLPFSGGEKARLALALLIWKQPQLLLLDEPTNHLDIEMRQALTRALQDYEGALLLVSHDRHLLRASVDGFLLVENGSVRLFDGDLDDYNAYNLAQHAEAGPVELVVSASSVDRRQQKKQEAELRQQRAALNRPLLTRLGKLEKELAALTAAHQVFTTQLADAALYEPEQKKTLQDTLEQERSTKAQMEALELEWLDLQEQLDKNNASLS